MFKYKEFIIKLIILSVAMYGVNTLAYNRFMSKHAIMLIPMKDADYFRNDIPAIGDLMDQ